MGTDPFLAVIVFTSPSELLLLVFSCCHPASIYLVCKSIIICEYLVFYNENRHRGLCVCTCAASLGVDSFHCDSVRVLQRRWHGRRSFHRLSTKFDAFSSLYAPDVSVVPASASVPVDRICEAWIRYWYIVLGSRNYGGTKSHH
ncbi:uncharacterized protein EV420DRAFT_1752747 [Desarmillaria tabescens]|uniref:Uncharacterized protein n=1 Tax=Armillaria tabescens TaxID=1929756 RepID=A0AA39JCP3_ARMTA|nr:uncharacterized protein EV420DRAFT_1752747 [Desarmillaria tabescens]KAK0440183.1 hypothetical protein EV420DRAFT_1752747 [Desarmillaria tabescens]